MIQDDERYMRQALIEAENALDKQEIPVGAVVVCNGRIVARSHNLTQTLNDPTAHAEMQAITAATHAMGGKYLDRCTLYVTVEPCPMCAAALYWAHLDRLVYGADDPKRGYRVISEQLLHPKTKITTDVLKKECGELVSTFFEQIRKKDSRKF